MRYADAIEWLYGRQRYGVRLGLDTIQALLKRLGNPEATLKAFHVGGTTGKGSVCAFVDAALRAAGHPHVGLYTSPHLVTFRERIVVDGSPIAESDVAAGVEALRAHVDELDGRRMPPTYFECATALAFDHFRRAGVQVAVVEVGLGGRLDATNVVPPVASVVTNVSLDHTERLGTSLQAIAAEKAGILRTGVPAVTAARREALDVLAREATRRRTPLRVVRRPDPVEETLEGTGFTFPFGGTPRRFQARLLGEHQAENAALALAAIEAASASFPVDPESAARGVAATQWPGRLEIVDRDPLTLLDGAHNEASMRALSDFLGRQFPDGRVAACVAILREKAATPMLRALAPRVSRLLLTEAPTPRTLTVRELEALLPADAPPHELHASPHEALRALFQGSPDTARVITGSLFLVGEARAQILRLERDPARAVTRLQ